MKQIMLIIKYTVRKSVACYTIRGRHEKINSLHEKRARNQRVEQAIGRKRSILDSIFSELRPYH